MLYLIRHQLLLYLAGYKLENILSEISHGHTVIQYSSSVVQQCSALYRSRDNFRHFSSVGMQDSQSAQTSDKTNKQLKTFLKKELSHGHTVIQYSSAVHHAEAGAISATFHQLFMSRTTDAQCNEAFSHRNPKL